LAVAGAFASGAWSIPVVLTVLYGINTVISCTYDLIVDYQEKDSQISTLNIIRDTIFGESFNLVGKILQIDKKAVKKASNIFYSGTELLLGWSGLKELGTKLIFGHARGFYAVKGIQKIKGNYGIMKDIGVTKMHYPKYCYDVYRISYGSTEMKNYSVGVYKEVKKVGGNE